MLRVIAECATHPRQHQRRRAKAEPGLCGATVTKLGVISSGGLQEGNSTLFALIGHDLHERDSGGIVDADVDELPTDAMVTVEPRQEMRFPTEPTRPSFLIPMWISSVGFSRS